MRRYSMKIPARALVAVALAVLAMSMTSAGAAVQWDQRNDGATIGYSVATSGAVQPFTPTLSSVDTVDMCFSSDDPAVVAAKIVDSANNVLGTSANATLPGDPSHAPWPVPNPDYVTRLTFSPAVTLTAGDTYTIQAVSVLGWSYAMRVADPSDPLGPGPAFWYREGVSGSIDPANAAAYVGSPVC